jgi:hypothetical protein
MGNEAIPFLDLISPYRQLEDELPAASGDAIRDARFIGRARSGRLRARVRSLLRDKTPSVSGRRDRRMFLPVFPGLTAQQRERVGAELAASVQVDARC